MGDRMGLAAEVSWSIVESAVKTVSWPGDIVINFPGLSFLGLYSHAFGAHLGAGYRIGEGLSLGMGARIAVIGPWRWLWYGEESSSEAYTLLDVAGASSALYP